MAALVTVVACASVIPDWNTRDKFDIDKKPRVTIIRSPSAMVICDTAIKPPPTSTHFTWMNVVVNQHNKVLEDVYITDNTSGGRFLGTPSTSMRYEVGLGQHNVEVGLYVWVLNEETGEKELKVTWRRFNRFYVKCCHRDKGLQPISPSDMIAIEY
jgi:hypothetical protein